MLLPNFLLNYYNGLTKMLKRKRATTAFQHVLSRSSNHKRSLTTYSRNRDRHHFSSIRPLFYYDTNQKENEKKVALDALGSPSPITELIAAGHLIFALAQSGACAAFYRKSGKRLCYMNIKSDETVRSIFLNRANDSIITVSVYKKDQHRQLRCRSTPLKYVRLKQPEMGVPVFVSECLKYPGFVEFDESNSKILTYSAIQTQYKVWDMKNYQQLFVIIDPDVTEIKMSPGVMLLIYRKGYRTVPLKMLAIHDGSLLHDIECPVVPKKPVEFVEQSNGKILMKQLGENLTIYDVITKTMMTVKKFSAPSAFIFLYINRLFLTFRGTKVSAWNFYGKQATKFIDHELWSPEASTNNNFISEDQHLLISFCKNNKEGRSKASLNISHCVTGELIHKLDAPQRLFMPSSSLSTVVEEEEEVGQEMVEMGASAAGGVGAGAGGAAGGENEIEVVVGEEEEEEEVEVGNDDDDGRRTRSRVSTVVAADETGNGHVVDEAASLTTAGTTSTEFAEESAVLSAVAPVLSATSSSATSSSTTSSSATSSSATSSSTVWKDRTTSSSPSANEDKLRTEALDGVTAIFFNEDHSEIYTGNRHGQVWVWGH